MRKLKLQMQITADGFVAGAEGQLDWMTWNMDEEIRGFIQHLIDMSDTILMGRKMTPGFIEHWEQVVTQPENRDYSFGRKLVDMPKVAFSKTPQHIDGQNLRVENGDVKNAVGQLKQAPGKDIIVYGGATFVSSLIEHTLIDEFNLFFHPVAIGNGMRIFKDRRPLMLTASVAYPCGVVVNTYQPKHPEEAQK